MLFEANELQVNNSIFNSAVRTTMGLLVGMGCNGRYSHSVGSLKLKSIIFIE